MPIENAIELFMGHFFRAVLMAQFPTGDGNIGCSASGRPLRGRYGWRRSRQGQTVSSKSLRGPDVIVLPLSGRPISILPSRQASARETTSHISKIGAR